EREELARFREEWKAEVRQRQTHTATTTSTFTASAPGQPQPDTIHAETTLRERPRFVPHIPPSSFAEAEMAGSSVAIAAAAVKSRDPASMPLPPKLNRALEVYEQAVSHEQRSELDEALRLYRQAFRLDENVAKVYEKLEYHARARTEGLPSLAQHKDFDAHVPGHAKQKSDGGIGDIVEGLDRVSLGKSAAGSKVATGTLAHLVADWPSNLVFEPEELKEPILIRILPDELLVHILQFLDVTSLERFATVNRKARMLTLDSSIWRYHAEEIYVPPQISEEEDIATLLSEHMSDYRRLYIEHPRIRLDGVYIAVCHYIRDGLSEHAWVNVSHLITYHRYLRFLPNGDVFSLLTNEEVPPQTVIPILNASLRMKGFYVGQWRLEGTTVYITNLMDPGGLSLRYTFQMMLELRSRPLGRWNRLDFKAYDSVSMESGEATPLALKNDRPFWFSKVRSYA
ncbi:hypothetical protein BDY19DRAFT_899405, partial [Irpex rosettiformis]